MEKMPTYSIVDSVAGERYSVWCRHDKGGEEYYTIPRTTSYDSLWEGESEGEAREALGVLRECFGTVRHRYAGPLGFGDNPEMDFYTDVEREFLATWKKRKPKTFLAPPGGRKIRIRRT